VKSSSRKLGAKSALILTNYMNTVAGANMYGLVRRQGTSGSQPSPDRRAAAMIAMRSHPVTTTDPKAGGLSGAGSVIRVLKTMHEMGTLTKRRQCPVPRSS
jgi:hypothetical protein